MNTRIRHLVLDPSNVPQRPCDHRLNLKGVQSDKSPSFTDIAVARSFAALLASKNKGTAYYIATVSAAVESFDVLPGETAAKEGSTVSWITTAAE